MVPRLVGTFVLPTLDKYECMLSTINVNKSIIAPTQWYHNCNTIQNIDVWWVSQGERIFVQVNYYLDQHHYKP